MTNTYRGKQTQSLNAIYKGSTSYGLKDMVKQYWTATDNDGCKVYHPADWCAFHIFAMIKFTEVDFMQWTEKRLVNKELPRGATRTFI
jgi:hypothetical protein